MTIVMHTDPKRFYAALGLEPGCSPDDIRVAYRRLAKEMHPDSMAGDTTAFIRLKRAYDTLSDPDSRANYDAACFARAGQPRRRPPAPRPPMPLRPRSGRSGGLSLTRYVLAFLFIGGLTFAGIQEMLDDSGSPPQRLRAMAPVRPDRDSQSASRETSEDRRAKNWGDSTDPSPSDNSAYPEPSIGRASRQR